MSKELEPIEALDKLLDGYSRGMAGRSYYDIVREALERLEAIDNVEPSEALEAFGRITLHAEYDNDSHYDGLHFEDDCKLVDKALERLEQIDNANPSEALKCLERYINNIIFAKDLINQKQQLLTNITIIKQALLNAEKEHKALEIINEKECDMRWFKYCIKVNSEVETYNNGLPEYYEKLTQEQFNLLKEVLE